MTNGEKIQQDFECEVCEPIIEDDIIHVIFADKPHSAIGFDLSWWNMEYKEPTTQNDLGVDCIRRSDIGLTDFEIVMCNGDYKEALKMLLDKIEKAPSVTPQEPRWIPVSERLPESDVEVLVTDDAGGLATISTDSIYESEATGEKEWYTSQRVTAWMPLPEPYREVEE